ncbi:MAG: hypothetical protein CL577_06585 [Alteromonadaceae bacterium]|nr:hypothetical protein [Alteromonadaceae bacterium]HBN89100.1 hypothetical protein [Rheinheimera sp.]
MEKSIKAERRQPGYYRHLPQYFRPLPHCYQQLLAPNWQHLSKQVTTNILPATDTQEHNL